MAMPSKVCLFLVVAAIQSPSARAGIAENFEYYSSESVPGGPWVDMRTLVPNSISPNPSGRIISTPGPLGTVTQAYRTTRAVGTSQGIVAPIAAAPTVSISADIRYDFYDNSSNQNGGGWPMAIGFFQTTSGTDPNFSPQVTLYSDSTFRNWSLYVQTSPSPDDFQFIQLTNAVTEVNTWYSMSLQVDTQSGVITSQVRVPGSKAFLVNDTRTINGWNTSFARYNFGGAVDGEYFTNATLGGQATVDNIVLAPSPGVIGLAIPVLVASSRRRRKEHVALCKVDIRATLDNGRTEMKTISNQARPIQVMAFTCVLLMGTDCASGEDILVSSRFSNSIIRYDGVTGALAGTFATGPELQNPNGMAFGPDGNLYVGLGDAGAVLRYHGQTGSLIGTFVPAGSGGLASVRDIAFGPDGNLYVNSGTTNQVLRFHGDTGAFQGVAAQGAGLTGPVGLTFGPDGSLFVGAALSNRVYQFGNDGALLRTYNPGSLSNVTGISFGFDGMLYASMSVSNAVARFNTETGTLLGSFGAGTGLNIPIYSTIAPGGDLLVGSFGNDSVRRFDPASGAFRGVLVAPGLGGLNGTHDLVYMPIPEPQPLGLAASALMSGLRRRARFRPSA